MQILKYLFFLLLLSLFASTIFVATQKGNFIIEKSRIINSSKSAVFNYVNDYKNWKDFVSFAVEDPEMKVSYSQNTSGKGSSYSWEGKEGEGDIQTVFVKENERISQKMNYNGNTSDVNWSFKDTIGGTKVTWSTKGKMGFSQKIYSALNGGIEKFISQIHEKSLAHLDKKLDYEINTYSVKVDGQVKKLGAVYLKQSFTSTFANITKNTRIVFTKIIGFCKQNNIVLSGKPFVIYHTYDTTNEQAKISICIPIKSAIYTSSGSDILSGKLEPFDAVKIILTGDYTHRDKALEKAKEYTKTNQIIKNALFSHLEIYTLSIADSNSPSKWKTEIYFPVWPKSDVKATTVVVPITPEVVPKTEEKEIESEF